MSHWLLDVSSLVSQIFCMLPSICSSQSSKNILLKIYVKPHVPTWNLLFPITPKFLIMAIIPCWSNPCYPSSLMSYHFSFSHNPETFFSSLLIYVLRLWHMLCPCLDHPPTSSQLAPPQSSCLKVLTTLFKKVYLQPLICPHPYCTHSYSLLLCLLFLP